MKTYRPFSLVWLLLGFFLLVVLVSNARAQHECQGGHNCNEDGEVIAQVSGDPTKIYSLGGSDMEINDCLATHSVLFGLWQGTHTNPYCEADKMDARGDHQGAAEMRCSTHKYRKVYGKGQACIDAVIYVPPVESVEVDEWDDEWEDKYLAQQTEIEAVREEVAAMTEQRKRAVATSRREEQQDKAYAQQILDDLEEYKE
jgi:hypothetical protein